MQWHGAVWACHLSYISNINRRTPALLLNPAREAVQDIDNVVVVVPAHITDIMHSHCQKDINTQASSSYDGRRPVLSMNSGCSG